MKRLAEDEAMDMDQVRDPWTVSVRTILENLSQQNGALFLI